MVFLAHEAFAIIALSTVDPKLGKNLQSGMLMANTLAQTLLQTKSLDIQETEPAFSKRKKNWLGLVTCKLKNPAAGEAEAGGAMKMTTEKKNN